MWLLLISVLLQSSFCFDINFNTSIDTEVTQPIKVEAEIKNWDKKDLVIQFPNRWGPATGLYKNIIDVQIFINGVESKYLFLPPKTESEYAHYVVKNIPHTSNIKVSYKILKVDLSDYRKLSSVYSVILTDHATIKGNNTFFHLNAKPKEYDDIRLTFSLPKKWKVYCLSEQIDGDACSLKNVPRDDLESALFRNAIPLGRWETKNKELENFKIELFRAGSWKIKINEILSLISKPIEWLINKMGKQKINSYRIIAETYPDESKIFGRSSGGEALYNTFYVMTQKDQTYDDMIKSRGFYVWIHEFYHSYNMDVDQGKKKNRNEYVWFYEGITEYMTHVALFNSGVYDATGYKDAMAVLTEQYWNSVLNKKLSIKEVSKIRWESSVHPWRDEQLARIYYGDVTLKAMYIDYLAEKSGLSNRMYDWVSYLWNNYGYAGKSLTQKTMSVALEKILNKELKDEWWRLLSTTKEIDVLPMLRHNGYDIKYEKIKFLGFYVRDKNNALYVAKIAETFNKKELAKIGIKEGDHLVSVGGKPVNTEKDFNEVMQNIKTKNTIVTVSRNNKILELHIPVVIYRKIIKN